MRKLNESIKVLVLLLLPMAGVRAYADKPPLPQAMGKYVMVLWPAGTPIPGDPKGTVKNIPEPDVEKHGGKLLFKHDTRRVILLPLAAAKELRKHEAVVYLQRIWMGEPLDDWDETYSASSASGLVLKAESESDQNLQWGPKGYQYDGSGNIKQIGADQYRYDSAGRLVYAQVSGATIAPKTETYGYDSFGNLIERGVTGANPLTIAVDGASNRMLGIPYDAAGNVTTADDGRRRYSWDSVNMLSRVHPSIGNDRRVIYDASDERLGTYLVGDSLTRWTIRDFEGQIIREFEAYHYGLGSWNWYWNQDNFYGEGGLLAGETQPWQYSSSGQYGGPRHYHRDHLGSVRMVTNNASPGRSLSEHDYYPFGTTATRTYQEQLDWANNHIDAMRFAGHWRDYLGLLNVDNTEYIDNMHARHYDPNLGRFLSIDPVMNAGRALRHPQSWNRYSYADNNPVLKNDPDGRAAQIALGAAVGAVIGVGFAGFNEIRISLHQPVTWGGSTRRVLGGAVGGAISGAAGATCGTCAFGVRLGIGIQGNVIAGVVNRGVSGTPQTMSAAQADAIGGAAGVAAGDLGGRLVGVLKQGDLDQLAVKAAAQRAEAAAQNLGLGADKVTAASIQETKTIIAASGVAIGESATNVTTNSLPPPKVQQPPAGTCVPSDPGCR